MRYTKYASFCGDFWHAVTLSFVVLNQKLAHRLHLSWETFKPILAFLSFFVLEIGACVGQTDGDRGMDGQTRPVTWPMKAAA